MCLGIPMQVVEAGQWHAWCEGRGARRRIGTLLVGEVKPGQWLLASLDQAREIIDAEQAAALNAALDALEQAAAGNRELDSYFSDLIEQGPRLPAPMRKVQP